ncbi:MAG TPA: hypothetical protein VEU96_07110 [Bryobacteraceae bacterium]|nr:hypothetical protein [Bryobacteraceae bacterium]
MRFPLLVLALALPLAHADDWPAPQIHEVFSHSRSYFVRVIPGKSVGDTVGFSGAAKGPYATAEFYRLEKDRSYRLAATASLLNPVAPIDFFVTDGGVLLTLDNWHNMGYEKMVAFYSPEGKLIRAYTLADLFAKSEIDGFGHSVSSIWWRKSAGSYVRQGEESFNVTIDDKGTSFIFEVSGSYQYCETREGQFRCRNSNVGRRWRAFHDPATDRAPAANRPQPAYARTSPSRSE